ncbi:MAG: hypothetical protein ABI775_04705 [Pseudonocardiales bacterium]
MSKSTDISAVRDSSHPHRNEGTTVPSAAPTGATRHQGIALFVIATAQLMLVLVLDDSIVNIALPRIQRALDVTAVHLPWIVNAYIWPSERYCSSEAGSATSMAGANRFRSALRCSSSRRSSVG